MNFKLILILSLGLMIFESFILFGIIIYKTYAENKASKELFADISWMYYGNIGVLVVATILNGLLFLKA